MGESWKSLPDVPQRAAWKDLPDAPPADDNLGVPDSPLRKALASQPGDVVSVDTPTGPVKMTRGGDRVLSSGESANQVNAGSARFKEDALKYGLAALSSGAQGAIPALSGALTATSPPSLIAAGATALGGRDPRQVIADAYRRARDSAAHTTEDAEQSGGLSAALLGQVPSVALGPASAAGRVGVNALVGLANGGFRSKGDITKGDVGGVTKDALIAAGVSGGLSFGGEGLGNLTGAIGGKMGRIADSAEQATVDAERAALEKAANSARGALGGETSSGARTLEQAQAAIADPSVDPAVKAKAAAWLATPEAQALRNSVLDNSIDRGAGQTGRIADARQAFTDASANIPGRAAQQAADKLDPSAVLSNLGGRANRSIIQPALAAAGGASLGAAVGSAADFALGDEHHQGGLLGAGAGAAGALRPGALQMMRNVAKYPPAQALAARTLQKAAGVEGAGVRGASGVMAHAAVVKSELKKPKDQQEEDAISAFLDQ